MDPRRCSNIARYKLDGTRLHEYYVNVLYITKTLT